MEVVEASNGREYTFDQFNLTERKYYNFAKEAIENFSEENILNFINNFNDNSVNHGPLNNYYCTFNPLHKLIEAYEENKNLYERLVQAEKDKVSILEKLVNK